MCRRAPALLLIPIRPPSNKNVSTKPKRCSGLPKKRAGLHPQRTADNSALPTGDLPLLSRPIKTAKRGLAWVMILLIDNYDSFTFNLVHYLGGLGAKVDVHRNDKISVDDVLAREPEAVVLSPGPCTPNEAGICLDLIKRASADIPIFGVCLGHQ